jgi:internalin A
MRWFLSAVLVTVALWSGGCGASRPEEDAAAQFIEKYGGKVTRGDRLLGMPVTGVSFDDNKVTIEVVREVKAFKQLASLSLVYCMNLPEEHLMELKELKQLTSLNLLGTRLTNRALKELGALNQLTTLNIAVTSVTEEGLKELAAFKQLTSLNIEAMQVTDDGLKHLRDLKQLTSLTLSATEVTDEGLKHLKELKQLTTLNLFFYRKVTSEGLKDFQEALPNCKIKR